jgi:hypothetical protein
MIENIESYDNHSYLISLYFSPSSGKLDGKDVESFRHGIPLLDRVAIREEAHAYRKAIAKYFNWTQSEDL